MREFQKKHAVATDTVEFPTDGPQRATRSPPLASRSQSQLQPPGEQPALVLPDGKFVTTLTLNSRTCRWPVGDPTELDFHYCGQPPNSSRPYCDAHDLEGSQSVRGRPNHRPQSP